MFFCKCCSRWCGPALQEAGGGTDTDKAMADQFKAKGGVGALDDMAKVL